MRLRWKRQRSSGDTRADEKPKNQAAEQPTGAVDEAGDDADVDTITAAKEARQRIHVSETTNWRYTSGLW